MDAILYCEDQKTETVEKCDYMAITLKNGDRFIIYDLDDYIEIVGTKRIVLYPSDSNRVFVELKK